LTEIWGTHPGQWEAAPPTEEERHYPLLTKAEDGRVLVVDKKPLPLIPPPPRKIEEWDPRTNAWRTAGTFTSGALITTAIPRRPHRLVVVDALGTAQELDLSTGAWQAIGGPDGAPALPHQALVVAAGPMTLLAMTWAGFETWTRERGADSWAVAASPPFSRKCGEDLRLIETATGDVFAAQPWAKKAAWWMRSERSWREVTLPEDTYDSARNLFALADGRLLACQRDRRAAWTIPPRTGAAMRAASLPSNFSEGTVVPFRGGGALLLTQKSAELWRPAGKAAGSFLSTNQAVRGQCCGNVAQLSDGRVLMEGPAPLGGMLWDGRAKTWTSTAGTKQARVEEAAIGLADGRVLVAGGEDPAKRFGYPCQRMPSDRVLSSTEVWDPATDKWTSGGDLHQRQWRPTLLGLKDGRVLALHGLICTPQVTFDKCAPESCRPSAQGEVWDPARAKWATIAPYTIDRPGEVGAAVLTDGRVLIAGGAGEDARAEIWSPTTGAWSVTAPMSLNRVGAQVTALADGRALVTGGRASLDFGSSVLRAAEVFDPRTNGWTATSPMQSARLEHSAALLADGRVLVAGCGDAESVARAEVWSASDGQWTVAGNVRAGDPRGRLFAIADGSAVFLPIQEPIEVWRPTP
jgi:Kelch motif